LDDWMISMTFQKFKGVAVSKKNGNPMIKKENND